MLETFFICTYFFINVLGALEAWKNHPIQVLVVDLAYAFAIFLNNDFI